jgi:16S rRNA (guanine527-N7)-methyltransferase
LTRIKVMQSRLEDFHLMESDEDKCDVALCKGVNIEHISPFLNHILKKNGKLVVFRSKNIDNHHPFKELTVWEEISYELPFGYGSRVLSIFKTQS